MHFINVKYKALTLFPSELTITYKVVHPSTEIEYQVLLCSFFVYLQSNRLEQQNNFLELLISLSYQIC